MVCDLHLSFKKEGKDGGGKEAGRRKERRDKVNEEVREGKG